MRKYIKNHLNLKKLIKPWHKQINETIAYTMPFQAYKA